MEDEILLLGLTVSVTLALMIYYRNGSMAIQTDSEKGSKMQAKRESSKNINE